MHLKKKCQTGLNSSQAAELVKKKSLPLSQTMDSNYINFTCKRKLCQGYARFPTKCSRPWVRQSPCIPTGSVSSPESASMTNCARTNTLRKVCTGITQQSISIVHFLHRKKERWERRPDYQCLWAKMCYAILMLLLPPILPATRSNSHQILFDIIPILLNGAYSQKLLLGVQP